MQNGKVGMTSGVVGEVLLGLTKFLLGNWKFCWVLVGDEAGKLGLVKIVFKFGVFPVGSREPFKG